MARAREFASSCPNDRSPIAVELDRRVEAGAIRAAEASPPPFARAFPHKQIRRAVARRRWSGWFRMGMPRRAVRVGRRFSAIAAKPPEFGIFFAFGNISDYLSSYILNGLRAVGLLSSAYGLRFSLGRSRPRSPRPASPGLPRPLRRNRFAEALPNPLIDKAPPSPATTSSAPPWY